MATRTASKRPARPAAKTPPRAAKAAPPPQRPPNYAERYAAGKALRDRVPRESHAEWKPPASRHDPVALVVASSKGRIESLVPIRYGRMSASPFTFYRGTALNMAADLAHTPSTGIRVQACGDCHLMNFGGFATPERRVIFDINDFDETLPGPWEWDVKRLAASFVHAARSNGFSAADEREAAMASARSYREHMREYAEMHALDVWYSRVDMEAVVDSLSDAVTAARFRKRLAKAAAHNAPDSDFPKLAENTGSHFVIKDAPPLIYHDQQVNLTAERKNILDTFVRYRNTLQDDRRVLLDRFLPVDFALKVVGVGSVGTFCAILLLMADDRDPLFLQVKESRASVLEPYVGRSIYANHGQRVVTGQRLMQSASDIFLGWTEGQRGRQFYLRQLRDMKMKPLVEVFNRATMLDYAKLCGWTLARAHARSGDAAMIAGYLGNKDVFDRAIARFSQAYADQAERDYNAFMDAIRKGRIEARTEA
ncbi:MAG: DUF2252 domain-containing protein [Burkholderiales bacterium]